MEEDIIENYLRIKYSNTEIEYPEFMEEPTPTTRPWKTFNNNYEEVDTESKKWFKAFLESKGHGVVIPIEKFSPYDIVSAKGGRKIYWELKTIDCDSKKWPDVKIDAKKIDTLKEFGISAFVVLFFEDRWTIVDVNDINTEHKERNKCNTTTAWKGTKTTKLQYSIKHRDLEYLNY